MKRRPPLCPFRSLLVTVGLLCCLRATHPQPTWADSALASEFLFTMGGNPSAVGLLNVPGGVALGEDGGIYVADTYNHRIQHLDADGRLLITWGRLGVAEGQFNCPSDVATGTDGDIYVVDTNNHRVQRFSAAGRFVIAWGGEGERAGSLRAPRGIAVSPDGSVLVADTGNHRIQRFAPDGSLLASWGQEGNADGALRTPYDVAVAPDGTVLVADTGNRRVQRFSAEGVFLDAWETGSPGSATLQGPWSVAADSTGRVYVIETLPWVGHPRSLVETWLKRFTPTGQIDGVWHIAEAPGLGEPGPARGLAVGSDGIAFLTIPEQQQIKQVDDRGRLLNSWGDRGASPGLYYDPHSIAIDGEGNLIVSDSGRDLAQCLHRVSWRGGPTACSFLRQELLLPTGVALDAGGNCYIVDGGLGPVGGPRVQCFALTGELVSAWGDWGLEQGALLEPSGIAVSAKDRVFISDAGHDCIQVYDGAGNHEKCWGERGTGAGKFYVPADIALAPDGSLYVSDRGNHRVQHFSAEGDFVATWGTQGQGTAQFDAPQGLAVDQQGRVYVADSANGRVQAFTADGDWLLSWERLPTGTGSMSLPRDVAVDDVGTLYVLDGHDRRVHVWGTERPDDWYAEWFTNTWFTGLPISTTLEADICYDWGGGAPLDGLPPDGFAARWQRVVSLEPGRYQFTVVADDLVRLWVGERLLIESSSASRRSASGTLIVQGGEQQICLEYADRLGEAHVELSWQQSAAPTPGPTIPTGERLWLPILSKG